MKVLNILWDINITRAGKAIANFEKYHDSNEFNTKYLLPANSKNRMLLRRQGAKIIDIDLIKNKSWVKRVRKVLEILKREKPDIINVHTISSEVDMALKLYGKGTIIHTRHYAYNDELEVKKRIKSYIDKKLRLKVYKNIIAVSKDAKQNLINEGFDSNNIQIIEDGAEKILNYSQEQKQAIKDKYNINNNEYIVSVIADLKKENGQEFLIDAVTQIASNKKVKAKFLLVGIGEYEATLKEKVKYLGLSNNIKFINISDNFDEILNISDIQIDASYTTKDYNSLLLEGMSIGIPAICVDNGINKTIVADGKNGFIVNDISSLAKKIEYLLINMHVYETIKNNSIVEYNNRFRADENVRNIQKYYRKISTESL